MNPMDMMKMAGLWRQFQARHPKFPQFLSEAVKPGVISEDAVLEFSVTTREGRKLETNMRLTREDLELFETLKNMR